ANCQSAVNVDARRGAKKPAAERIDVVAEAIGLIEQIVDTHKQINSPFALHGSLPIGFRLYEVKRIGIHLIGIVKWCLRGIIMHYEQAEPRGKQHAYVA